MSNETEATTKIPTTNGSIEDIALINKLFFSKFEMKFIFLPGVRKINT